MRFSSYILLLSFATNAALAQSDDLLYSSSSKTIVGGSGLKVTVDSKASYIDNYLYSDEIRESTALISIAPKAQLQIEKQRHLFKLVADAAYTKVDKFSEDNHLDYSMTFDYYYKITTKSTLAFDASVDKGYIYRGTNYSIGNGELLDKGDDKLSYSSSLKFDYGSADSVMRLNSSVWIKNSEFTSKREITNKYDVSKINADVGFDYMISGKAYLSSEVIYVDSTFTNDLLRDNKTISALLGFKWETSPITKIAILGGYQKLDFTESAISDRESNKWKVNINWSPLEYTNLAFLSGRSFEDANRAGELFKEVDENSISANHSFSYRLTVAAKFGVTKIKSHSAFKIANEEYSFGTLGFKYQWIRIVDFFGSYGYKGLESNLIGLGYDRNQLELGVRVII